MRHFCFKRKYKSGIIFIPCLLVLIFFLLLGVGNSQTLFSQSDLPTPAPKIGGEATQATAQAHALAGGGSAPSSSAQQLIQLNKSGDAQSSIPLFTIRSRKMALPITANYRSGIKANQKASEIGLGWSINFGSIVRDYGAFEPDYATTLSDLKMEADGTCAGDGDLYHCDDYEGSIPDLENKYFKKLAYNSDGNGDPDKYHVSAPGLRGNTFWNYGEEERNFVWQNLQPLKLDYSIENFVVPQEISRINQSNTPSTIFGTNEELKSGQSFAAAICIPPYVSNRYYQRLVHCFPTSFNCGSDHDVIDQTKLTGGSANSLFNGLPKKATVAYDDYKSFAITNEQGIEYVFGRALRGQKYVFDEDPFWSAKGFVDGDPTKVNGEFWKIDFIAEWLLTEIRYPDYVDVNGNGADEADKGDWIRIEYTTPYKEEGEFDKKLGNITTVPELTPKHREWMNFTQTDVASSLMRERAYVTKIVTPIQEIDLEHSTRFDVDHDYFKIPANRAIRNASTLTYASMKNGAYALNSPEVGTKEDFHIEYPCEVLKYEAITITNKITDAVVGQVDLEYATPGSEEQLAKSAYLIRNNANEEKDFKGFNPQTENYEDFFGSDFDVEHYRDDTEKRGKTTLVGIHVLDADQNEETARGYQFDYGYNPDLSEMYKRRIINKRFFPTVRSYQIDQSDQSIPSDAILNLSPYPYKKEYHYYRYGNLQVEAAEYLRYGEIPSSTLQKATLNNDALVDELGYYTNTGVTSSAGGKDAWSLTQIVLPTGGHIDIVYEKDQCDINTLKKVNTHPLWQDPNSAGAYIEAFTHPIIENYNRLAKDNALHQAALDFLRFGVENIEPQDPNSANYIDYYKQKYHTFDMRMNNESGGIRVQSVTSDAGADYGNSSVKVDYAYGTGQFTNVPASYWRNYFNAFSSFHLLENILHSREIGHYADQTFNEKQITAYHLTMSEWMGYNSIDNTVSDNNHYYTSITTKHADGRSMERTYGSLSDDPDLPPNHQKLLPVRSYQDLTANKDNDHPGDDENPLGLKWVLAEDRHPGHEIVLKSVTNTYGFLPVDHQTISYEVNVSNNDRYSDFLNELTLGGIPKDSEHQGLKLWNYTNNEKLQELQLIDLCDCEDLYNGAWCQYAVGLGCNDITENTVPHYYKNDYSFDIPSEKYLVGYSSAVKSITRTTQQYASSSEMVSITEFDDDDGHYQVEQQTVEHTDGTTYTTQITYPQDYPLSYVNEEGKALNNLRSKNIQVPIETIIKKNGQIIGGNLNTFRFTTLSGGGRKQTLPYQTFSLATKTPIASPAFTPYNITTKDNAYELKGTIILYDKFGNVQKAERADDVIVCTNWDNSGIVPISVITNGLIANENSFAAFYEYDNIFHLPSRVTSITNNNKNIAGTVTQVEEEDGVSVYYEYDSFGRLITTRDDDHQIREHTVYHHKNDPTSSYSSASRDQHYVSTIHPKRKSQEGIYTEQKQLRFGSETIHYLDGLGRVVQQTAVSQSSSGKDIIMPIRYDDVGSVTKQFLPYTTNSSAFIPFAHQNDVSGQSEFYTTELAYGTDGQYAYAERKWEQVNENGIHAFIRWTNSAPGMDWTMNGGQTSSISTGPSRPNKAIPKWKADGTKTENYHDGELLHQIARDENEKQAVHTFTNSMGQLLVKTVAPISGGGSTTNTSGTTTHYIYDDFGNLVYVVPPQAVKQLETDIYGVWDVQEVADYIFEYRYDHRQRMTYRKIPGKEAESFVYDRLDRIVLSRDGELRTKKQWLFTKYDVFSRPVITGIYTHSTHSDDISIPDGHLYEQQTSSGHGYSNNAFPKTNMDILTINYYDDYEFEGAQSSNLLETAAIWSASDQPAASLLPFQGQLTGTKVKVLKPNEDVHTTDWITTSFYYSKYGELIAQIGTTHQPNELLVKGWLYDFLGQLKKERSVIYQISTGEVQEALQTYAYNSSSQQLTDFAVSAGANKGHQRLALECKFNPTARYRYNELGQLVQKRLHNELKSTSSNGLFPNRTRYPLQTVDYNYNIRGWLTQINSLDTECKDPPTGPIKPETNCWIKPTISLVEFFEKVEEVRETVQMPEASIAASVTYLHAKRTAYQPDSITVVELTPERQVATNQLIRLLGEHGEFATQREVTERIYPIGDLAQLTNTIAFTPIDDYSIHLGGRGNDGVGDGLDDPSEGTGSSSGSGGVGNWDDVGSEFAPVFTDLQPLDLPERQVTSYGYTLATENLILFGQLLCQTGELDNPNSTSTTEGTQDLFALSLYYNNSNDLGADQQYNGNIAAVKWQVKGQNSCAPHAYAFTYDYLNRLKKAKYYRYDASSPLLSSGSWKSNNRYTVDSLDYDLNGNLLRLSRMGWTGSDGYDFIDDLHYSYVGNQLQTVTDKVSNIQKGFIDAHNLEQGRAATGGGGTVPLSGSSLLEYLYDDNGNLVVDKNKEVFIAYNHLDLPQAILKVADGQVAKAILFVYDAMGTKLTQYVYEGGGSLGNIAQTNAEVLEALARGDKDWVDAVEEITGGMSSRKDYIDAFEFTDGIAEAYYHVEGRIFLLDDKENYNAYNNAKYEYTITDHLGNGRVYFGDKNNNSKPEILQENHYYPFGMKMEGQSDTYGAFENNYQYNGQENLHDIGLDWINYGPRLYNPAIGRWNRPDPLADIPTQFDESPYGYAWGNPIALSDPTGLSPGLHVSGGGADPPEDLPPTDLVGYTLLPTVVVSGTRMSQDLSFLPVGTVSSSAPMGSETHSFNRGPGGGSRGGRNFASIFNYDYIHVGLIRGLHRSGIRPNIAWGPRHYNHSDYARGLMTVAGVGIGGPLLLSNPFALEMAVDLGTGGFNPNASLRDGALKLLSIPLLGRFRNISSNLWRVGSYRNLRGLERGLDAHHVGQKAVMARLIPNYNINTAPAILVPRIGHTRRLLNMGVVSRRTRGITNARDLLARDILELRRVYGSQGIPNSSLQQLIQLNKRMYPEAFRK